MMRDLSVGELSRLVAGKLNLGSMPPLGGEWEPIQRLVTDCREVQAGDVLVALDGKNEDCLNQYEEAFARGALGVVSRRRIEPWAGKFSVMVNDLTTATRRLKQWARDTFCGKVVAIAGPVGAECTAKLVLFVAAEAGRRVAFRASINESPLDLLELDDESDIVASVSDHASVVAIRDWLDEEQPDIVVLTGSVATTSHAGDETDSVAEWIELMDRLPKSTRLLVNADDPILARAIQGVDRSVVSLGRSRDAQCQAVDVRYDGTLSFQVDDEMLSATLPGRHHVTSMLSCWMVAEELGIDSQLTRQVMARFPQSSLEEVAGDGNLTIIRGVHRGNRAALHIALSTLADFPATGRRVVVCIDRCGQGVEWSPEELGGAVISVCGADCLMGIGGECERLLKGAQLAGMRDSELLGCCFGDECEQREFLEHVQSKLQRGDTVLVLGYLAEEVEAFVNGLGVSAPEARVTTAY